ncbi:50S ribosomal protein L1 [Buchnera aphidicola (Tetraneura ulmi)]|uniref:50S ribosomal protein L1 n=1 Tax=Buchnera aphidicola TaxID=9 RepID=UPI0034647F34
MKKNSKRKTKFLKKIDFKKKYTIEEGIKLLKKISSVNFTESLDIILKLGIDPKKSDQNIRGTTILPHGIGKKMKIVVFSQGKNALIAKENGADFVGAEDLLKKIQNKEIKFDIVIASPDTMHIVGKISSILGPRGLMPNPKLGTVTENIKNSIKNFKNGQIRYKNEKNGILHTTIGKINFPVENLKNNFITLLESIKRLKPTTSKGIFIKKIFFSTTMGPAITIDSIL